MSRVSAAKLAKVDPLVHLCYPLDPIAVAVAVLYAHIKNIYFQALRGDLVSRLVTFVKTSRGAAAVQSVFQILHTMIIVSYEKVYGRGEMYRGGI